MKEYQVPNSWGEVRRIGVDSKGVVWASEFDIDSFPGSIPRRVSSPNTRCLGAPSLTIVADKKDNIWVADQIHSTITKFDQKTAKFTFYPMPQPHQSVNKIGLATTTPFGSRRVAWTSSPVIISIPRVTRINHRQSRQYAKPQTPKPQNPNVHCEINLIKENLKRKIYLSNYIKMEKLLGIVRVVCNSSFALCAGMLSPETPKKKEVRQDDEEEENEIIENQTKATASNEKESGQEIAKQSEEKWENDFESWNKKAEIKKENKTLVVPASNVTD